MPRVGARVAEGAGAAHALGASERIPPATARGRAAAPRCARHLRDLQALRWDQALACRALDAPGIGAAAAFARVECKQFLSAADAAQSIAPDGNEAGSVVSNFGKCS